MAVINYDSVGAQDFNRPNPNWDIGTAQMSGAEMPATGNRPVLDFNAAGAQDFNLDPVQLKVAADMVGKAKQAMEYLKHALSGLKPPKATANALSPAQEGASALKPSAPEPQGYAQPVQGGMDSNQAPQGGVPDWLK